MMASDKEHIGFCILSAFQLKRGAFSNKRELLNYFWMQSIFSICTSLASNIIGITPEKDVINDINKLKRC
jgi:hypothetical protein